MQKIYILFINVGCFFAVGMQSRYKARLVASLYSLLQPADGIEYRSGQK